MEGYNINLNKQPLVIITTQGNVANGKTSIIKCLTKKSLMKFKKEAENNMTIKLGYTNEFKVLEVLNKNFGLFVSHSKIIEEVWDNQGESTNIQRAVSNLRRKLKDAGMNQVLINAENGHYSLSLS